MWIETDLEPITNLKFDNYTTLSLADGPTNLYAYQNIPTVLKNICKCMHLYIF